MSSLNEVDAESLVSAHSLDGAAADVDGHLQLRRMFSASLLGSFLRRDVGRFSLAGLSIRCCK